jgi:hypothetical protein
VRVLLISTCEPHPRHVPALATFPRTYAEEVAEHGRETFEALSNPNLLLRRSGE